MYDSLKVFLDATAHSDKLSLFEYLIQRDENPLGRLVVLSRDFARAAKKRDRALNNRALTAKKMKANRKAIDEHKERFCAFLAHVNIAHNHLYLFCKMLYLVENKMKYLTDLEKIDDGKFTNNFPTLVKNVKAFDSTDKEAILMLNSLRNILCHTSLEAVEYVLNEEMLQDAIDIATHISEIKKMFDGYYHKEIENLIEENLKTVWTKEDLEGFGGSLFGYSW